MNTGPRFVGRLTEYNTLAGNTWGVSSPCSRAITCPAPAERDGGDCHAGNGILTAWARSVRWYRNHKRRPYCCFAMRLLLLILALVVCGAAAPAVAGPSDVRSEEIKSLEVRAASSDANAQLALAKLLLDGTETQPNYERAKGLLVSASKVLPEALIGLVLLRVSGVINDDTLPAPEILLAKAKASEDAFVSGYFRSWYFNRDPDPPESMTAQANSGNPQAQARLASGYADISSTAANCRRLQAHHEKWQATDKKLNLKPMERPSCSAVPRPSNSYQLAIRYGSAILDAKEIEADKIRYWGLLGRRLQEASRASTSNRSVASDLSTLSQLFLDSVAYKEDPYWSVIADGLSAVGRMIKDGDNASNADSTLAVTFLTRAAELGNRDAQNAIGELYKSGRWLLKDYELAARYFAQSAQQASDTAPKSLAIAFLRGQGVEQNKVQAYVWFSLSTLGVTNGRGSYGLELQRVLQWASAEKSALEDDGLDAATVRDELAETMKPEEVAEAQRLARQWRPSYQVGPPPSIASIDSGAFFRNVEAPSPARNVPMKKDGGTWMVPVLINNAITLDFTVDSGAADVSIPEDVVSTLIRAGTIRDTDFIGEKTYVLADGSRVKSKTFRIRSLKVGDRVLENVTGSIAPTKGSLLLGQSFLGRFKSWSIDNTKHALVLE